MMIQGDRLRLVRKLRRLTQTDLGKLTGVQQETISQIERGTISQPSLQFIDALVLATGFPPGFFERPPGPDVPIGSLAFRARRSVRSIDIDEAHAWAQLVYECANGLANRLRLRPATLPNLSTEKPEKAAQIARSHFGLAPDGPIANVTYTLEQRGIVVLALPVQLPDRDAFSMWAGINPRYPVMVVSSGSLDGRLRFTVSHELDHLIAPDLRGDLRTTEAAADHFAAEFLLPQNGIEAELSSPCTLPNLIPLAGRWGVSVQNLVMRALQLGHISERRARQLYQQIARSGFSRAEPPEATIRIEKPRAFRQMAERVYGNPVDPRKFAKDFDLPLTLAGAILGGHAERFELVATIRDEMPKNILPLRPDPT